MLAKPPQCQGCSLYEKGIGWAPTLGSTEGPLIAFIGEALGKTEAERGEPFVGQAGMYLNRAFARLGLERSQVIIGNTISCQPPNDWLIGAPWEHSSIAHCHVHRTAFYASTAKVYVTLGMTATKTVARELLGIEVEGELKNWHGYVLTNEKKEIFVVPTYHPAYMLRGNQKLFGVFLHDVKKAMEVASFGWQGDNPEDFVVVDPPVDWFRDYVNAIPDDEAFWLAVDTETTTKGDDEDDLEALIGTITRVNFAVNGEQGITVPYDERYRPWIQKALNKGITKLFWNAVYDVPILAKHGITTKGRILDGMWAWHMLQTDVPKSLGFVAPFYSKLPPWKHLNATDPGGYAAIDGVQTVRCLAGIMKDLKKVGLYDKFMRYVVLYDAQALEPMSAVGIKVSRTALQDLSIALAQEKEKLRLQIVKLVPEEIWPLAGGWKREPKGDKYPGAFMKRVKERVLYCSDCDTPEVGPAHRCKKETA